MLDDFFLADFFLPDKLHETVKKVLNAAAEIDNQYGDSPRKIVENITKICADTLASMETDNNGKLNFRERVQTGTETQRVAKTRSGETACPNKGEQTQKGNRRRRTPAIL